LADLATDRKEKNFLYHKFFLKLTNAGLYYRYNTFYSVKQPLSIHSPSLDIALFGGETYFGTPCEGEMVAVVGGGGLIFFFLSLLFFSHIPLFYNLVLSLSTRPDVEFSRFQP